MGHVAKEPMARKLVTEGLKSPICPLRLALYGHPDAGGYWEKQCGAHMKKIGFEHVTDWRSFFCNHR